VGEVRAREQVADVVGELGHAADPPMRRCRG
jgi:hypothetical protein